MVGQPLFSEISVEEFAERRAIALSALDASPWQLIDVREPQELELSSLEGFLNFPLSQFAEWSSTIRSQLNPDAETIVMCHHGMRSAQMSQWLMQQGFTNVKNLTGGIDAYSIRVDPQVPRY